MEVVKLTTKEVQALKFILGGSTSCEKNEIVFRNHSLGIWCMKRDIEISILKKLEKGR